MNISVLYLGRIECKKNDLIQCSDADQMIKSPISAILIRHPTLGNLLYDTGNSPFYSTEYPKSTLETYPIPEFISIEDALKQKGMTPADIDTVILSHLHFDHAGGLRYFKGTKAIRNVIVSEAELKNAYYQVMTGHPGAYVKSLFDLKDIRFTTINEATSLAEDIKLFIQQSHTPGLIGMILKTETKGTLLVTGDTIYTKENYEKQLPPGGSINKTTKEFYENLTVIKKMATESDASIIYGHDYPQIILLNQKGGFH